MEEGVLDPSKILQDIYGELLIDYKRYLQITRDIYGVAAACKYSICKLFFFIYLLNFKASFKLSVVQILFHFD